MLGELTQYFLTRSPPELLRDVLDVFITYYIFYRIALVLKGTRAIQVGLGLVGVAVLYVFAQVLRLHTVLTLLSAVLSSAILIGVVVFQNDIRRGLMRVGAGARLGGSQNLEAKVVDDVVEAATTLARHRIGAIITFEQDANLDEFVGSHTGQKVDAAVSPELLVSLFVPEGLNKLHDGAVVIRDLRIAKAGVFFPMPEGRVSDESFGSRHRAAMGITEETDAVVIVVSEERGSISFCFNGNIIPNLDGPRLRAALDGVFAPKRKTKRGAGRLARWFGGAAQESQRVSSPSFTMLKAAVGGEAPASSLATERHSEIKVTRETLEIRDAESSKEGPRPLRKRSPQTSDPDARSSIVDVGPPTPLRKKPSPQPEGERAPVTERSILPQEAPAPLRKKSEPTKVKPEGDSRAPGEQTVESKHDRRSDAPPPAPLDSARPMPRAEESRQSEPEVQPREGSPS